MVMKLLLIPFFQQVTYIMSGTESEEDFKTLQAYGSGDGDDDLGLFGDLSSFEGLALEEDMAEQGSQCPNCM